MLSQEFYNYAESKECFCVAKKAMKLSAYLFTKKNQLKSNNKTFISL